MFFDDDIKGDCLPRGTVALTYDDGPGESAGEGPGPHTGALGRYLHDEGIRATFFVVGHHVGRHRDSVTALYEWGHLVGNHTDSHPGLVALAESGGDVVGEVARTEGLLRTITDDTMRYFRAPYGNWRQTIEVEPGVRRDRPDSIVAAILNASGKFPHVVGPFNWDIVAEDWECWRLGVSPEEAARRYVAEFERVGRGLVLMHDSSEDDALRPRNQTYLMTRAMVPELKRRGYRFVRLDEVPQARTAALVRSQVVLADEDGRPLALDPAGSDQIAPDASEDAARLPFGVAPLSDGHFALRARNGLFLSLPDDGPVTAASEASGPRESFALEALGAPGFAIRCATGGYLTLTDTPLGPRLAATPRRRDRLAFSAQPVHLPHQINF
ncbi:MAG TPA: polysaccharide deacetylase family protein [Isosphaeraceae bacterium]|nr:polysaccharide deacetylase family protein [Isosphaeraceae bacterium]